jgi:hypothetical protein
MPVHFKSFLKVVFPSARDVIASLIIGASFAAAIYLGLLQRHFFSYRYLFYALLIFSIGTILIAWLNQRVVFPIFKKYPKPIRYFTLSISLLIGIALFVNVKAQPLYYILPESELEIRFNVPERPDEIDGVHLLWIETGQGFVHYSRMDIQGVWERTGDHLFFPEGSNVRIGWRGKVGQVADVVFRHTNFDQPVEIVWNGNAQTINLNQPRDPFVYIRTPMEIPVIDLIPFSFSFFISVGYTLFAALVILGNYSSSARVEKAKSRWILHMAPMLLIWGFSLLIFWPGIMSTDAVTQWAMGVTGKYNDWQSAFHALILAGLMRIWHEPAFVALIQIFFFALAVAWGLRTLEHHGVPRGFLWGISFIFALLPTNMLLSITLWKDIPYAIAFLWLTGVVMNIALSQGDWLKRPGNWIILVISAFLVSIFRQNGAAVSLITLISLLIIYQNHWKFISLSLVTTIFLFILVKGPLYSLIGLDRESTGQTNLIFLHHIAAHLDAGTEIDPADRVYLNSFQAIEDWEYSCCYVGTISYDRQFNRTDFLKNTSRNRELAIDLFLRDPGVDIRHAICAAELSWNFENSQCYTKSSHGFNTWRSGNVDWIVRNDLGLEDNSRLPHLVDLAVQFLRFFGFPDDDLAAYLRPAFWLYIGIFTVSAAAVRRKDLMLLFSLVPLLSQTLILFLISFAPAYRYHFGTVLASILLLGLLFLPSSESSEPLSQ